MTGCTWTDDCAGTATHWARMTYYTRHHEVCDAHAQEARALRYVVQPLAEEDAR